MSQKIALQKSHKKRQKNSTNSLSKYAQNSKKTHVLSSNTMTRVYKNRTSKIAHKKSSKKTTANMFKKLETHLINALGNIFFRKNTRFQVKSKHSQKIAHKKSSKKPQQICSKFKKKHHGKKQHLLSKCDQNNPKNAINKWQYSGSQKNAREKTRMVHSAQRS